MRPLAFFPESSLAFAEADLKLRHGAAGRLTKPPIAFARDKWMGSEFGPPGEGSDRYFNLFFRNGDPLGQEFESQARMLFAPLVEHWRAVNP